MRSKIQLSEFDFDIIYKKGEFNTQADALSRLQSLGLKTSTLDGDIPIFPYRAKTHNEGTLFLSNFDVLDYVLKQTKAMWALH